MQIFSDIQRSRPLTPAQTLTVRCSLARKKKTKLNPKINYGLQARKKMVSTEIDRLSIATMESKNIQIKSNVLLKSKVKVVSNHSKKKEVGVNVLNGYSKNFKPAKEQS